jgi:hypothetical protein
MMTLNRGGISHAVLMRESTDRVERALHDVDDKEHLVANRVLESPQSWQLWENEHSGLMRQVAGHGVLRTQAVALRHTALRLIEGKALFEYLRRNAVRGAERQRIVHHFYPTRRYHSAVISEHGGYVRKACSYLCTNHVGSGVAQDPAFIDAMQYYEELYGSYFDLYCSSMFPSSGVGSASELSLLPLLKHQLTEWRWMILNPRQSLPRMKREREMRRATEDTQRLPQLRFPG